MPTTLAQNQNALSYGGGASCLIKQIHRIPATGLFDALTGTDCFGGTAGTWHDQLSLISSSVERQEDATHKISLVGIEDDLARKMLLLQAAPYAATSLKPHPALSLENGVDVVKANSAEKTDRPYFQVMKWEYDPIAGFGSWFFAVMQFNAATKRNDKDNTLIEKDFSLFSVDAKGYVCTAKTGITVAAPTLSGSLAHGTYVDATA